MIPFPYSLQEQRLFRETRAEIGARSHRLLSLQKSRKSTEFFWERKVSFLSSLKKQPIFHDATTKWRHRAMTAEIPSYGWRLLPRSADWMKQISLASWPIKSTTLIWVVTSSGWNFCRRYPDVISRGNQL